MISEIQRYCIHDGPGVRTVVFLKGCPLRCRWCANPEAISFRPELMVLDEQCIGCGRCVAACTLGALSFEQGHVTVNRPRCDACGDCAAACPTASLRICGTPMSVEEVIRVAARDMPYYRNSGGGVTLSGGEPAAQPGFSVMLLKALRDAGIHSAIETSGCAPAEHFDAVAGAADLVLFDLKHTDPAKHEEQTGVPNGGIVGNLKRLVGTGKPVVLRIPVVPGVNDAIGELVRLANFAKGLGDAVERIDLLPYHRYGVPKYARLGMASCFNGTEPPPPEKMEEIAGLFRAFDVKTSVGG